MSHKDSRSNPSSRGDLALYGRLLAYIKPYIAMFLVSIFGWALHSAMQVAAADILQFVVDTVQLIGSGATDVGNVADKGLTAGIAHRLAGDDLLAMSRTLIPALLFAIVFLRGIGFFIGSYAMTYVGRGVVFDLRTALFDRLLSQPSRFFDRNMSGHLVSRVTFHVEQVTAAVTSALKVAFREGMTVVGLLAYMLYLNWKLTMLFFVVFPIIGLVVAAVGKRFRRISGKIQNSMGDVTHVAQESISGYLVMRMFGGEGYERARMQKAADVNRRQTLKMAVAEGISTPLIQMLVALALGILMWLALDPNVISEMSSGQFVAFLTAAGLLTKPIRQLSEINSVIQRALAAATTIFDTMDSPGEPDEGRHEAETVRGDFHFRNVSFSYGDPDEPVLRDISFDVGAGQVVALVGRSGSGKSTLVSLISRFYNHDRGEILLDGTEINEYRLANLRRHIGLVTQSVTLFNDTIFNNIAYGELAGASREQVREAARAANALEFIERLPEGFETVVGDDGVMLSGGQRQRLAIARALLKNAPILILDEATSALDTESEQYIQTALEKLMQGRTTFVIAHRLSTIENADLILVLDQGRIVESGRHEALLAQGARYAQLYHKQFVDEDADAAPGDPGA